MKESTKNGLIEFFTYVGIIIVVLLIKMYLFSFIRVNGQSMLDTLKDRDIMILNKINYRIHDIKRFDIVVVKYENEYIIKRVIGLPGEVIEYKNNTLYVNGKVVDENFKHKETNDFNLTEIGSRKIREDCYFVVGDNRGNSLDSRVIGQIKKEDIVGRAKFTIFPITRFGYKR